MKNIYYLKTKYTCLLESQLFLHLCYTTQGKFVISWKEIILSELVITDDKNCSYYLCSFLLNLCKIFILIHTATVILFECITK